MAKYLDKTEEEWDDLIDKWHFDNTISCSLQDYLELDDIEFLKLAHGFNDKNINDEEVLKRSSEIAKDVVTELVIKPTIAKAISCIKQ